MKKHNWFILSLVVLLASACVHEFPVIDHSFDFSGAVVYDGEADQHRLTLTCVRNSGADQYNIAFSMDGENVITLTDMEGRTYQDSFKESFTDSDSHTYVLSEAAVGNHVLQVTISTDEFSQSLEIPYETTRQKYDIHAEVSTVGSNNSVLMMSLASGDTKYTYAVTVSIDGDTYISEDIDFSQRPIASIDLPNTIRPQDHTLTLSVNDSMTTKEYSVEFTEPVRHPALDITLSHDDKSGYHVAQIGPNPYSIQVDISADLELKGKASYYPSHDEDAYWYRNPYYDYLTEQDSASLSESEGDKTVNIIGRDGMAEKITSKWVTSYIWASHSTPGGGEDSGYDSTFISGSQPAFYQIYSEVLNIGISAEAVPGVTLNITNSIGKMTLNGQSSTSGTTSITL